ncbi:MAG: hypothetical protein ACREEB_14720 [Caulobacteraceae bacterium]
MGGAVLILSQDLDPHADRMVLELARRGARCVRWHPDSLNLDGGFSVTFGGEGSRAVVDVGGERVSLEDISSVWNRRPAPFVFPPAFGADERLFAEREIGVAFNGLLRLRPWFWVNHPDKVRFASLKLLQLDVARKIGLETPSTLVSNEPESIAEFVAKCSGQVVYKTLASPFLGQSAASAFTSVLTAEHLRQLDKIRFTGGIFQEYVPKHFEIRVTIIGQRLFSTEIHSQEDARARVDFRAVDAAHLRHQPHVLPAGIEAMCRGLLDAFGLVYGAIDLIVTPDGRYVFLENNPSGQFGWIEELTDMPLTASLADMLIACQPV